jgi:uncharacterized BrkB/YihY/UPF0761 family membrane protein
VTSTDEAEPAEANPDAGPSSRAAALAERAKVSATARITKAETWVGETAHRRTAWNTALALRTRDQDAFASVLGSAIALRLFLFSVALVVALISTVSLVFGRGGLDDMVTGVGMTGEMAEQVASAAATTSTGRDLSVLVSSVFVALLAGRSLTMVLAACSAGAWRMPAAKAKASARTIARVTMLVALVVIAASGLNRLRNSFGIAVATSSFAVNMAMLGVGWFFVTLSLPRPTRDPGALLPGAAVFAVAMTLVQWFMHYYLPYKIESASQTMGSLSVTVASLGYLFVIGRVMAGTVVLNAVVFEEFGSLSRFVFDLPGVRRLPVRYPKLSTFFDLDAETVAEAAGDGAGDGDGDSEAPTSSS